MWAEIYKQNFKFISQNHIKQMTKFYSERTIIHNCFIFYYNRFCYIPILYYGIHTLNLYNDLKKIYNVWKCTSLSPSPPPIHAHTAYTCVCKMKKSAHESTINYCFRLILNKDLNNAVNVRFVHLIGSNNGHNYRRT